MSATEQFIATHRERASRVLEILAKLKPFKKALESDIGKMLLSDLTARMEEILEKTINEDATPQELAEFRALRGIAAKWAERISAYNHEENKVLTNKI